MKSKKIIVIVSCVLIALIFAFAMLQLFGYKGEPISSVDLTKAGENTKVINNTKDIDDCTPNECLYILSGNVEKSSAYKSSVHGEVQAGIYKQVVDNLKYKSNNNFFAECKSTSTIVNVGKQTFYSNNKIILRDATNVGKNKWSESFVAFTLSSYLEEYGVDQRELTNYILNDSTIKSSELVGIEDGIYTFKYILNIDSATKCYKINMVKMGSLKSLPQFSSCEIYVSMTENFEPIKIECIDKYKVSKLGIPINCTSSLVETFECFNDTTLTIPNEDLFISKL